MRRFAPFIPLSRRRSEFGKRRRTYFRSSGRFRSAAPFSRRERPSRGRPSDSDVTATADDVTATADDVTATADDLTATADDVTANADDVTATADDVTATADDGAADARDDATTSLRVMARRDAARSTAGDP